MSFIPVILVLINIAAVVAYGSDKLLAKTSWHRVSERALLIWMVVGVVGAVVGMLLFKHKTRKTMFQLKAIVPFLLGVGVLSLALYWA